MTNNSEIQSSPYFSETEVQGPIQLKGMFAQVSLYTLLTIIVKAIGFIMIPIYTRYLSPAEYGTLELLEVTTSLIEMFAGMGIGFAIFKFYYQVQDEQRARLVSTSLLSITVILSSVATLGLTLSDRIASLVFQNAQYAIYFRFVFVRLFIIGAITIGLNYLQIKKRTYLFGSLMIFQLLVSLSLTVYLVVFLSWGITGVIVGSVAGQIAVGLPLAYIVLLDTGFALDLEKLRAMLKYGSPFVFTLFGQSILNYADRFFLQRLSNLDQVGIYSLGYKFGFIVNLLVVSPFIMMWQPTMFELENKQGAQKVYSSVLTYFFLALVSGAMLMSVFIKEIIYSLTDPKYYSSYAIVPFVSLAYVFNGLQFYFRLGMLLKGKTLYVGLNAIVVGSASLIAFYFGIRQWGAMGAAFMTALTYGVLLVSNYIRSQQLYPIRAEWRRMGIIAGAAVCVVMLSLYVECDRLMYSVLLKVLCVMLFPLVIAWSGFLTSGESRFLLALLPERMQKVFEFCRVKIVDS